MTDAPDYEPPPLGMLEVACGHVARRALVTRRVEYLIRQAHLDLTMDAHLHPQSDEDATIAAVRRIGDALAMIDGAAVGHDDGSHGVAVTVACPWRGRAAVDGFGSWSCPACGHHHQVRFVAPDAHLDDVGD